MVSAAIQTDTLSAEAERWNRRATPLTAGELISAASADFGDGLVMSSSFGAHSAVMLHLVATHAPKTRVILIDTGYLFPETYRFAEELRQSLSLDIHTFSSPLSAARQEALFGKEWEAGEEGVARYLERNKVEPMQRALRELGARAWMAGLRRGQTAHRRDLPRVGVQDGVIKIHPILEWSTTDVVGYLSDHNLPLHPLVSEGYRSIGDVHSTLPTTPDMDPRAGRLLGKKQECGLHLSAAENRSLKSSGL